MLSQKAQRTTPLQRAIIAALLGLVAIGAGARDVPKGAWPAYRDRLHATPVQYTAQGCEPITGGRRCQYDLVSQTWPENDPAATAWHHRVTIYQPDGDASGTPLLVINNGTLQGNGKDPARPPSDMDDALLSEVATTTHRAVVSVGDAPNQYLTLAGDVPRKEDDLVAATWVRSMRTTESTLPLHVPMAAAATRAMDLATSELKLPANTRFIVTGSSKRAWAAWLTTVGDDRIAAIVPYVIAMHIQPLIEHIQKVYGGDYPIALLPYQKQGIGPDVYRSPAFAWLMHIEDPYTYLDGPSRRRLAVPKYLVNASGDDFFPPDAADLYVDDLPGSTTLRVAPNSDHGGIRNAVHDTLLPFLVRWDKHVPLPRVNTTTVHRDGKAVLSIALSETPVSATVWHAVNPASRDFRYACGIRYQSTPLDAGKRELEVTEETPDTGWGATFVEFRFADGFIATTPVSILPEGSYPTTPPANGPGACLVIPPTP